MTMTGRLSTEAVNAFLDALEGASSVTRETRIGCLRPGCGNDFPRGQGTYCSLAGDVASMGPYCSAECGSQHRRTLERGREIAIASMGAFAWGGGGGGAGGGAGGGVAGYAGGAGGGGAVELPPSQKEVTARSLCRFCGAMVGFVSAAMSPKEPYCSAQCQDAGRALSACRPTRANLRALLERHIPASATVEDVCLDLLDVEVVARKLWQADPAVKKIVEQKADAATRRRSVPLKHLYYEGRATSYTVEEVSFPDPQRLARAYDVAWKIDESGLRTKWVNHVRKALRPAWEPK